MESSPPRRKFLPLHLIFKEDTPPSNPPNPYIIPPSPLFYPPKEHPDHRGKPERHFEGQEHTGGRADVLKLLKKCIYRPDRPDRPDRAEWSKKCIYRPITPPADQTDQTARNGQANGQRAHTTGNLVHGQDEQERSSQDHAHTTESAGAHRGVPTSGSAYPTCTGEGKNPPGDSDVKQNDRYICS